MYSFNITILGEGHPLSPGWQGPGRYFNPPSPCGEGLHAPPKIIIIAAFQSTLPVWGGTPSDKPKNKRQRHFNPPSPCGEGLFLLITDGVAFDISIHPPHTGRDLYGGALGQKHHSISIHPPRVGRDATRSARSSPALNFNPPSPCGEGRLATFFKSSGNSRFQSTLPVWGGTA